jgi:putative hemolysin
MLGANSTDGRQFSEAELRDLVATSALLDGEERRIIDEVLAAGARHVREVMVPRTDVVFLDAALALPAAVKLTRAARHSRFPVIDGSHDDVVGFVHLRDMLIRPDADQVRTVGELTREVKRLPASKRVLAALSEMRREGRHLAVVVDEYGGTAGIVTLEDLIEELVGEIHDEYDLAPDPEPADGARPSVVDGRLNLGDFAEVCGFTLPPGPYETLGGFLMARLGRVPRAGDEVRWDGWRLVVAELDGRRVARVGVAPASVAPAAGGAPAASVAGTAGGATAGGATAGGATAGGATAGDGTAGDGTAGDGTAGGGTAGEGTAVQPVREPATIAAQPPGGS